MSPETKVNFSKYLCRAIVFSGFIVLLWTRMLGGTSSLTLTDKLGRTVTVSVPLKRAVIIITYELIPALGIWDQVAGVSRWAETECDIYKAIIEKSPHLKKPHVGIGTDINVEAVMALKPDLVITWTYNPAPIRFLEEKGINVFSIYPESFKELYEVIRLHGVLFGKTERAEQVISEMEKLLELIRERVKKISSEEKLRVVHLLGKPTTVSGAIGITDDLINLVGAINVGSEISDRNADVSVERIVKWNPDVIFIWGNAGYSPEWILENSQWQHIKAVQKKQVYKLPKWSTWSPRIAPIALWMAMKIYPERFQDISFQKRVEDFYIKVFDLSYNEIK